jgi:uncharacterized protein
MTVATLWAAVGAAQAQEIRCNQVFENPSEKAICASPELLAIDAQMAQAYRDAKPHLKGLGKDQRAFKRDRKACKGDMECLLRVYETQTAELRAAVPPSGPAAGQGEVVEQDASYPTEADQSTAPAPTGLVSDVATQEPSQDFAPGPVDDVAQTPPVETAPQSETGQSDGATWVYIAVAVFLIIGAIGSFFSWLFKAVDRCPRCTRWWAGKEFARKEQMGTEYETVERVDKHRSRGAVIKEVTRQEQIAYNVVHAAVQLECKHCGNTWFRHEKRRA